MSSKVYFAKAGGREGMGPVEKVRLLFERAGFKELIRENDLVAVKMHFGERGNTSFISPAFVRPIIEKIIECGGRPFLTDTGCLYFSSRSDAREHLIVAAEHGFSVESTLAPVIVADGLLGSDVESVRVNLKHFDTVELAGAISHADSLIVLTHVTGHGLTGLAATIKNIGMGAGSRRMKLSIHDSVRPKIDLEKCDMCLSCVENCPQRALSSGEAISIDKEICIGCGQCIAICPKRAISITWRGNPNEAQEKLAEICHAVLKNKKSRVGFLTFAIDITPTCDCWNYSQAPAFPDIGYLASLDPVAIDQAAADLVNRSIMIKSPRGKTLEPAAPDKFFQMTGIRWERQLSYAEEIGLGSREYELEIVGE
ncbi:MAG: DUF362 domain-containing protein [Actinomycetota bacterium]|nr:DUF362 domain-containing protein [Actinomycetota bacterium]